MVSPRPPGDPEQRNIIDKLAEFVARNGQEFEALTRDKQRDNPKFAFLHGGEYYDYYVHRVEEARKHWMQQRPPKDSSNQWASMTDHGPQWDQFSGDFEYWQQCGTRPPGPFGWNAPDPSWFQKPPWPGNPPFQRGPQVPESHPYPFPRPDTSDPYRPRGYGGPDFRFPGDQSTFRPPNFPPYGFQSQRNSRPTDNYGSGSEEFTEADIEQSEKNLQAQYDSLQTRQEMEIQELLVKKREQRVRELGQSLNVSWEQMNEIIQPLIEACTKENISKGKTWVVEKMAESPELTKLMSEYLVARASALNVTFDLRLHLVYLLNDLLHHCKRRGAPVHLQEVLQKVVPIIFCLAAELADDERKAKINRVLDLWDSNSYLPPDVLLQMRPPQMEKFLNDWKEEQTNEYQTEVEEIKSNIKNEYATLKCQHNEFADYVRCHVSRGQTDQGDGTQTDSRYSDFGSQQMQDQTFNYWGPPSSHPPYDMPPHDMMRSGGMRNPHHRMPSVPPPSGYPPDGNSSNFPPMGWPGGPRGPPPNWNHSMPMHFPQSDPPGHRNMFMEEGKERDRGDYDDSYEYNNYGNHYDSYYHYNDDHRDNNFDERPHSYRSGRPSRFSIADPSYSDKDDDTPRRRPFPPSGSIPATPDNVPDLPVEPIDLDPKCQPWQLPAGLMHPLIRLRDFDYVPLDGQKIRLLAPTVPTERLLTAIDNFYLPPSHDRTRDGEGWERLGLYEFYTKKEKARDSAQKLEDSKRDLSSNKNKRRRQHSGGSAASSLSEDDSIKDKNTNKQDGNSEHDRPFTRDDSIHGVRYGPPNLSYITSYPKIAVGQPVRTGLEALTCVPPPIQCVQGQLTHNYPGYKAVGPQPVLGSGGIAIPPPRPPVLPGVGASPGLPGFPGTGFLQFPPPIPPGGLNQPPPPIPMSQGMLHRPPMPVTPGFSSDRSRFDSRRSRSGSRSDSRSKSRSPSGGSRSRSRGFRSRSQSRSRSRSRSPRSRSHSHSRSRSRSRDSRSRSRSPRGNSESDFDGSRSRGFSGRRRRDRSDSRSCSGSPFARFTSAAGPGGFTPGSGGSSSSGPNSSARAAAMAAAASIANSINQSHNSAGWNNPTMGPGSTMGIQGPYGGCAMGPNASFMDGPYGSNFSGPPNRGMGGSRGGFSNCVAPGRGPNMRFPGMGPEDRFHQLPRDCPRR